MRASASESASDVARVKDIFLRLLGMQKSCRSLFCLPHLLFITLQFSPTEKSWLSASSTQNLIILLPIAPLAKIRLCAYLRAIINGSKQHQFCQVVVDHQSCDEITVTPSHFKSKLAFFLNTKNSRVASQGRKMILTLS